MGIEPIYVEANPDVYNVLKQNVPSRECHLTAISDHVGSAKFHVTSFDQSSSLLTLKKHATIYPDIVEQKVIQVPCTTVDELLGDRFDQVDLINMDIQGAELMALRGATKTLPHVSCILTEVNREELYSGCAMLDQVDKFLSEYGFERTQASFKFHPSWGDAFYVKRHLIQHRSIIELLLHHFGWGNQRIRAA
jgi:FkbM family methyltransferase